MVNQKNRNQKKIVKVVECKLTYCDLCEMDVTEGLYKFHKRSNRHKMKLELQKLRAQVAVEEEKGRLMRLYLSHFVDCQHCFDTGEMIEVCPRHELHLYPDSELVRMSACPNCCPDEC